MTTLTRRNPLASQTDITLATETTSTPGSQLVELLPSQIYIDAGLQTRDKMSQETITEYAEAMANGDQFPPLTVYHNGATYALVKGFHRIKAHIAAFDNKPIRCKVVHGNRRDALKEALSDNADHGLRLTREDKRKKVKIALADEEWGQWSDREIAKLCKVSHPLVAEVRREVTGNSSSDNGQRTYTNKHGTTSTMRTERISQANSARSSTTAAADDAMPYAAIIEQIAAAEPDALQSPPQSLMIDESLTIILGEVRAAAASPTAQLAWLRARNKKEAFLHALQPGATFNNYCFNQAHQQAIALIEAEAAKTAQEAPQPPAPSLTPPAAPTP